MCNLGSNNAINHTVHDYCAAGLKSQQGSADVITGTVDSMTGRVLSTFKRIEEELDLEISAPLVPCEAAVSVWEQSLDLSSWALVWLSRGAKRSCYRLCLV